MSRFLRLDERLMSPFGERIVFSIRLEYDIVEVFDPETKLVETISCRELRKLIATGEWQRADAVFKNASKDLLHANEKALQRHTFYLELTRHIRYQVSHGKSKAEVIEQLVKDKVFTLRSGEPFPMCSARQAYRVLALAEQGETSLLPRYHQRGNRTSRYGDDIEGLILELIEEQYAVVDSRITVQGLQMLVNVRARAMGLISQATALSRKYITKILVTLWNPDRDYKRLETSVARAAKAVAQHRIRPGGVLHRVEMDSCNLPMVVKTPLGVVKNPWLMVAIDCETSMPLGWLMMIPYPTVEDTLQCVERVVYLKQELFSRLGVNSTVDPYGAPINLVIDNGSENKGPQIDKLSNLGINPERPLPKTPQHKPFIERLFGCLKPALEMLGGCTRFNGEDGARTEAAFHDNLMSLEELEHWVVRWLFEKWANKPLERFITADFEISRSLGVTPAERWKTAELRYPLPLSPAPIAWVAMRYVEIERSVSPKTGVPLGGFRFRGGNLKKIINQYGPDSRVKVRYRPSDYRTVYVEDRVTGELIELINAEVSEDTPAFSFGEARARRKRVRDSYATPHPLVEAFDRDLVNKVLSSPKPRSREAQREIRQLARSADAVQRSKSHPIQKTEPLSAGGVDTFITEDSIPSFTTSHKPSRHPEGVT